MLQCKIINLTPHPVCIYNDSGTEVIVTFKSHGEARCTRKLNRMGKIAGVIPITKTEFRNVQGLPDKEKDVYYIVSRYVFAACPDRDDLLMPDVLVRDSSGDVVGCKTLSIG